jgi:hypothetical protein
MEAACSSETSVSANNTAQWYNPKDYNLNSNRRDNLKIYNLIELQMNFSLFL